MQWAGRVVLGLWVALSVLTWAPRFGEAADATVTGTGRFVFRKFVGNQWVEVGIKRARVEMCDDDSDRCLDAMSAWPDPIQVCERSDHADGPA